MIDHEKEGKKQDGISRRQFLKFCGVVAGALGLDETQGLPI
jgi:Ni,Fe-hydrogenase I small subunit